MISNKKQALDALHRINRVLDNYGLTHFNEEIETIRAALDRIEDK